MFLSQSDKSSSTLVAIGIGVLFFFLVFPWLGLPPIGGSSEAREAQVASVIIREGEWILPTRNGLMPSKPPLYHWITAGLQHLVFAVQGDPLHQPGEQFALSPLVARTTSLIGAALVLIGVVLIALRFSRYASRKRDTAQNTVAALAAAVILVSTYGFLSMALRSMVDMTYVVFSFWSVAIVVLRTLDYEAPLGGEQGTALRSSDMTLFFVFAAFATLGKGPLGFILSSILLFTYLSFRYGTAVSLRLCFTPRIGWAFFVCIVLPWYLAAAYEGSSAFIGRQILFENIQRFTGGEDVNIKPVWFYLPEFLLVAAPWSLLYGVALWHEVRVISRGIQALHGDAAVQRARCGLGMLGLIGIVLFSIPAGKRHAYLLPLYPWVALYLGIAIATLPLIGPWVTQTGIRWFRRALPYLLAFQMIALGVVVDLALRKSAFGVLELDAAIAALGQCTDESLTVMLLVSVSLLITIFIASRAVRDFIIGTACFFVLVFGIQLQSGVKGILKGYREVSEALRPHLQTQPRYVLRAEKDERLDAVLYYLGITIPRKSLDDTNLPQHGVLLFMESDLSKISAITEEEKSRLLRFKAPLDQALKREDRTIAVLVRP
jgi:4-amino-4-deoxy-L-arabinose transferase-like glycosyltransferase